MFVLFAMSYFLKRVNLMLFNDIIHLGSVSNNMTRNQKSRSTLNSRRSSGRIGSQLLPPPKIQEIIEGVVNVHYPKKANFS
jgi:hypothetical protein